MARILVIDDEDALRQTLTRHFRRSGHIVTEVANFQSVRDHMDARRYDIIFLDICMPGMSGREVCGALRIAPSPDGFALVSPPPIVLMTGHPDLADPDYIRTLGGGIYCCMAKPFSLSEADEVMMCCLEESPTSTYGLNSVHGANLNYVIQ